MTTLLAELVDAARARLDAGDEQAIRDAIERLRIVLPDPDR